MPLILLLCPSMLVRRSRKHTTTTFLCMQTFDEALFVGCDHYSFVNVLRGVNTTLDRLTALNETQQLPITVCM